LTSTSPQYITELITVYGTERVKKAHFALLTMRRGVIRRKSGSGDGGNNSTAKKNHSSLMTLRLSQIYACHQPRLVEDMTKTFWLSFFWDMV